MEVSKIHEAGVLKNGEEIAEHIDGRYTAMLKNKWTGQDQPTPATGVLVITNKRLFFLQKPGIFSSGMNMLFHASLGDILSVSTSGLLFKKLNISIHGSERTEVAEFFCEDVQLFAKKIIDHKNQFVEEKTVEATRVIIEEGKKDSAMQILQKRLARGEITKEEFHEKVQRT